MATSKGFLTDTSLCIGCKACEVACKQWNQLPMDGVEWLGTSYDNTHSLGATTWRHVTFAELPGSGGAGAQTNWLMMSDVCKHCTHAGCLEACPTGAIMRTEFDTVVIQQDVCNGCGYCVPSCPFGVVELDVAHGPAPTLAGAGHDGKAHKCTLCYDRLQDGLEPACAKACPTDSIIFGDQDDLWAHAEKRVAELQGKGLNAYHYGDEQVGGTEGVGRLGASFILLDEPHKYNLPEHPILPQDHTFPGLATMAAAAVGLAGAIAWALMGSEE
ncbi:MAG TPA: 4Fe-4S dicluster domain-containing protein [Chloroflexota bacterium]|nr:4Fe-4S dicluster domain-containing protein [Chloroflexota bacterium]